MTVTFDRKYCRVPWTFNGANGVTTGALVYDSRKVHCFNDDNTVAWTNSFRTRREAWDRFCGDLRAMRKNDCYTFGVNLEYVLP